MDEIVFIINSPYPNYAGGIENWLYNISTRISNKTKVTIISIDNEEYPILYDFKQGNINFIKVKTLSSFKFLRYFIRGYIAIIDIAIASFAMRRKLNKYISKSNEFVYIISLDTMFCVFAGLLLKQRYANSKLIASSRGPHAEIYGKNFPFLKQYFLEFENRMLSKVDEIWANGEDTILNLREKGFNASLMLNGVDFKKFNTSNKSTEFEQLFNSLPSIVNVSTLIPIKGIKELLDAADYIINNLNIKLNFIFIGKGDPNNYIEYTKTKRIFEYVYFIGHKSNVNEIIKLAKVCTCLSGGSGLSMAAIESLASGVPTVAWDSPVYRQFNQQNEYLKLVKPNDPIALGMALVEVINNYDFYLEIAKNAKEFAKTFDWEKVTQSFLYKLSYDNTISN